MSTTILQDGDLFRIVPPKIKVQSTLPLGIHSFTMENFAVIQTFSEFIPFKLPKKMFGNIEERAEMISKVWDARNRNTAILCQGLKGSGKSLLTKLLCNMYGEKYPIVKFDALYDLEAQLRLLEIHQGKMVLVLDEFEKVFWDPKYGALPQEKMLSFLDGINNSNILSIITVNDVDRVDEHLFNRPGRVLFNWKYGSLDKEQVSEIVEVSLKSKSKKEETIAVLSRVPDISYDIVSTVVELMNILDQDVSTVMKDINLIPPKAVGFKP